MCKIAGAKQDYFKQEKIIQGWIAVLGKKGLLMLSSLDTTFYRSSWKCVNWVELSALAMILFKSSLTVKISVLW